MTFSEAATGLFEGMGIMYVDMGSIIMVILSAFLMFLAVAKKVEPLLLIPLAFGILIANIPMAGLAAQDGPDGLLFFIYLGVKYVVYPPLIFLCIGSMTDFGPLIGNPKSLFIGLGGQLGLFTALFASVWVGGLLAPLITTFDGFTLAQAASIAIIGSSDGPTAIFTATHLAPEILPAIAIAAYSYMALVPVIQPPIARLLTNDKERVIVMPNPKRVTKRQKLFFPIIATIITLLLVPAAGALIGMLMLGNFIRESGVAERYVRTLNNELLNVLTLLVALSIGASAKAEYFLRIETILIILLGLFAFISGTFGGVLIAKLLCKLTGGKINPLIGNSGVSAMPMAARVSQKLGQEYNPHNHLLMHAMGPIVASTMGSAIIAGIFVVLFQ